MTIWVALNLVEPAGTGFANETRQRAHREHTLALLRILDGVLLFPVDECQRVVG